MGQYCLSETKRRTGTSFFCFNYISRITLCFLHLFPFVLAYLLFYLVFLLLDQRGVLTSFLFQYTRGHEKPPSISWNEMWNIFLHMPESEHGAFSLKLAKKSSNFWCMLRIDCARNIQASMEKHRRTHAAALITVSLKITSVCDTIVYNKWCSDSFLKLF